MDNTATNELGNKVFLLDLTATVVTFLSAFLIRNFILPESEPLSFSSHLFIVPLTIVLITVALSYFGGYRSPIKTSMTRYSWSIIRALVASIGLLLIILFFFNIQYISRIVLLLFALLELAALLLIRLATITYFRKLVKSGEKAVRVLVVGTKARARDLVHALREHSVLGLDVIGFVDPDANLVGTTIEGIPVIATVENIHDCLKKNVIDEVIIAISRSLLKDAEPIVQACEEEGIRLRFMADVFNVKVAQISLSMVRDIPLLAMEPVAQDPQQLLAKRIFDLSCTIIALPLLVPLFLLVALAIKLDSPGPVFFIQQRVGLRKHIFPMYKFRSMHVDAEARLAEIEHLNEAEGPIFKIKNDPRVTRVGRFLRKTSIDELPQLINVLRGEMSLVGPRPMSQRDVNLFDRGIQRKRFSVQPGITCIWQISGRSNLPFEKWLELDLEYIGNWSFWLDISILLKTLPAILKSKGAS
jgi:exopolysaccharide biosynthesis polyprenyl glycosylphosphotransferase